MKRILTLILLTACFFANGQVDTALIVKSGGQVLINKLKVTGGSPGIGKVMMDTSGTGALALRSLDSTILSITDFKGNGTTTPITVDTSVVFRALRSLTGFGPNKVLITNSSSTILWGNVSGGSGSTPFETESQTYFTNAGVTDTSFQRKYDNFVKAAKSHNYYTKIYALFPYAGNATQDRYDAITASAKATFSGTWMHSNGVDPDGASYANSGVAPNEIPQNSLGYFSYAMEDWGVGDTDDMLLGCRTSSGDTYLYQNGNIIYGANSTGNLPITSGPTTKTGLYGVLRLDATTLNLYHNADLLGSGSSNSSAPISYNFYIGANDNTGVAGNFSSTKQGATGVLNGFTPTDWGFFQSDFQTFLTAIGR